VKTHVEHIYKKLGATDRSEAVALAEGAGLLPGTPSSRPSAPGAAETTEHRA